MSRMTLNQNFPKVPEPSKLYEIISVDCSFKQQTFRVIFNATIDNEHNRILKKTHFISD